jgi:hypothetical protein
MKKFFSLMLALLIVASVMLFNAVPVLACDPDTNLDISASSMEVSPGEEITLYIAEDNTGDVVLYNVSVTLSDGSTTESLTCLSPSFVTASDANSNAKLDCNETWRWEVTRTVNTTTTFAATGYGEWGWYNTPVTYPEYPDEYDTVTVTVDDGWGEIPSVPAVTDWGIVATITLIAGCFVIARRRLSQRG